MLASPQALGSASAFPTRRRTEATPELKRRPLGRRNLLVDPGILGIASLAQKVLWAGEESLLRKQQMQALPELSRLVFRSEAKGDGLVAGHQRQFWQYRPASRFPHFPIWEA